jgi:hypothetical protein
MSLFDDMHQWQFPKEWRIPAAESHALLCAALTKMTAALEQSADPPPAEPPPATEQGVAIDDKFIAELATGLWRMRARMVEPETDRVFDSMRRPFRHLESVWELLRAAGIDIQDHTSEVFNSGLALSVIAFQPTEGLERERVLETIRPSIYRHERVVQMGQVIVGTPVTTEQPN